MIKKRLVEILWLDAEDLPPGWHEYTPEEITHNNLTATYGLFVAQDEYFLYHASTFEHNSQTWSGMGRIPVGMIHSIIDIQAVYYDTDDTDNT